MAPPDNNLPVLIIIVITRLPPGHRGYSVGIMTALASACLPFPPSRPQAARLTPQEQIKGERSCNLLLALGLADPRILSAVCAAPQSTVSTVDCGRWGGIFNLRKAFLHTPQETTHKKRPHCETQKSSYWLSMIYFYFWT